MVCLNRRISEADSIRTVLYLRKQLRLIPEPLNQMSSCEVSPGRTSGLRPTRGAKPSSGYPAVVIRQTGAQITNAFIRTDAARLVFAANARNNARPAITSRPGNGEHRHPIVFAVAELGSGFRIPTVPVTVRTLLCKLVRPEGEPDTILGRTRVIQIDAGRTRLNGPRTLGADERGTTYVRLKRIRNGSRCTMNASQRRVFAGTPVLRSRGTTPIRAARCRWQSADALACPCPGPGA
jgi:hypothetical protein